MADPRIAVLTLTRDRLEYTKVCFESLRENAGMSYSHYVLDNGSVDGTDEWLASEYQEERLAYVALEGHNLGVTRGFNRLLDTMNTADYDAIVTVDNDAELTMPNTLAITVKAALAGNAILSPHVQGLRNKPETTGTFKIGKWTVSETAILGNIFMAIPAHLFDDYRFPEDFRLWAGGEDITGWFRDEKGGKCGYLDGWTVNHYLTTNGQLADMPGYFARRAAEGGPPI